MEYPGLGADYTNAVNGPGVEAFRAVRLRLQPDPYVLDRAGEDAVGEPGEGPRKIVLGICETGVRAGSGEMAAGVVKGTKLD